MERIPVTVRLGIATMPDERSAHVTEDLFQCADIALYYNKEHGRNRVTHYSQIANEVGRPTKAAS